ncbi:MAG: hypothetical protein H6713_42650 [Myxococcales bacterium]|nr:hypothetical protein [Myxococcales bacterium]MCB9756664.1 hypothetical protein [Myxococcales bacterium]
MTIPQLYSALAEGGPAVLGMIAVAPLLIGGLALLLNLVGQRGLSQGLCNLGIIAALTTLVVEIGAIFYATQHGVNVLEEADVLLLGLPLWLIVGSFVVEHLLHPGKQENIRQQIRAVLLVLITVSVLFFILGRLKMHMVIFGSIVGFILFIIAIVGVLYWVMRKVV